MMENSTNPPTDAPVSPITAVTGASNISAKQAKKDRRAAKLAEREGSNPDSSSSSSSVNNGTDTTVNSTASSTNGTVPPVSVSDSVSSPNASSLSSNINTKNIKPPSVPSSSSSSSSTSNTNSSSSSTASPKPQQQQRKQQQQSGKGTNSNGTAKGNTNGSSTTGNKSTSSSHSSSSSATVAGFSHLHGHPTDRGLYSVHNFPSSSPSQTASTLHPLFMQLVLSLTNVSSFSSSSSVSVPLSTNQRCTELLLTIDKYIQTYQRTDSIAFSRSLDKALSSQLHILGSLYVNLSPTEQKIMKWLRSQITTLNLALTDENAKLSLTTCIQEFITQRIQVKDSIVKHVLTGSIFSNLQAHQSIIVYGNGNNDCSLVHLLQSMRTLFPFPLNLVIVDNRPFHYGQEMLRTLRGSTGTTPNVIQSTINLNFVPLSGLAAYLSTNNVYGTIHSVLLAGNTVFNDGSVQCISGSGLLTLIINYFSSETNKIPVYCVNESYTFVNRTVNDSILVNELIPQTSIFDRSNGNRSILQPAVPQLQSSPTIISTPASGGKKGNAVPEVPVVSYTDKGTFDSTEPLLTSTLGQVVTLKKENSGSGSSLNTENITGTVTNLKILGLQYDTLTPYYLTGIVSDIGYIPIHYVPVIINELDSLENQQTDTLDEEGYDEIEEEAEEDDGEERDDDGDGNDADAQRG